MSIIQIIFLAIICVGTLASIFIGGAGYGYY
jgi:hypothetical protein